MTTFDRRGHTYRLDGEPIPSVTTILKLGFPAPALVSWAAKSVAQAAVDEWTELSALGVTERYERLKGAPWVKRDAAAFRGTQLHAIGEQLVAGEQADVPDHLQGVAQRYADWLDEWDVEPVAVERPVCHVEYRYAGTFDLIADLKDGVRWLLDIKSGSGVYDSHVLQLAGYRYAEKMLHATGDLIDMPTVDRAGVIHVTPDDVRLIPVDASRRAFRAFLAAREVASYALAVKDAYKDRRPWPVGQAVKVSV